MEGEIEGIAIVAGVVAYLAVVLLSPDTDGVELVRKVVIVVTGAVVVARDCPRGPSEVLSTPGWRRTETSTEKLPEVKGENLSELQVIWSTLISHNLSKEAPEVVISMEGFVSKGRTSPGKY